MSFSKISQRFLNELWILFPQDASARGLHQFDAELGSNSPQTWQAYGQLLTRTLAEVEAIPESSFQGDAWLDRRGLLSMLRTELFSNQTRQDWRINPQIHCDAAINSLFHLTLRHSERLAKIAPALESRLAKIPQFLAEGAACLRAPIPLWTQLARQSCDQFQGFLTALETQLLAFSKNPAQTRERIKAVSSAFAKYAASAEKRTPGAANGFSIGREGFEFLTREKTGLPYSLPEIRTLGRSLVERFQSELSTEARKFGRKKASQILEEAAARWSPQAGSLLEEYQRLTTEVRTQFEAASLVTFPEGERCRVVQVPPFLQHHFPTAAYSQPGAFDRDQTGIFWVNDLSQTQSDPVRKAAEIRQHFGLEFTCAHEAYPGHHLQFVLQNQHPSKLRRLFHHAIFYEGWTLWCEKMAVDHALVDLPEARLIQLHDALWRAHRIGIDCGLHDGSLSYKGACQVLQDGVGFTPGRARGDVNWYTSSPTVPMSYLLGRLEVERLHAQLVGREGWPLQEFNDCILSFGAIPWQWIWESRLRPAQA